MNDYQQIQPMLVGRWEEILEMYGISVGKWKGKNTVNQSCPCCGGEDRAHWREQDGRIALYCRGCAADSMKSPESVIMELTGVTFGQLVNDLAQFANYQEPEKIKKAQIAVAAKPRVNMPDDHRQDHEKSLEFLERCTDEVFFKIFATYGCDQPPMSEKCFNGLPIYPLKNSAGIVINVACVSNKGISFIAGGHSYGAWYTIDKCSIREATGVKWFTSIRDAYDHWWTTGQECRVTFHDMNTLYLLTTGFIDENSLYEKEKALM